MLGELGKSERYIDDVMSVRCWCGCRPHNSRGIGRVEMVSPDEVHQMAAERSVQVRDVNLSHF